MEFKRLTSLDNDWGRYVCHLLVESFPEEERPDLTKWETLLKKQPAFSIFYAHSDEKGAGLITYWNLSRFVYVEHLAIDPSQRGKGLGSQLVKDFCTHVEQPVVLEVERPTVSDMARRRIAFYERCGFKIWLSDYLQPPYRPGDAFLPLYIMVYGALNEAEDYLSVRNEIHERVYGYKNE